MMTESNSELNIRERVENQIHLILKEMEEQPELFAFKERLAAITTIGMFLTRDVKLRASDESINAGSAVRKYSGAFKTSHVAGGRAPAARRAAAPARPALAYDGDAEPDDETAA